MFRYNTVFSQDLSNWDTSNIIALIILLIFRSPFDEIKRLN